MTWGSGSRSPVTAPETALYKKGILRPHTGRLQSALLDGKDPAETLQQRGPAALHVILRDHRQPLSALIIDAHLEPWQRQLHDTGRPYLAMCSTATLLPPDTATQSRAITGNRKLRTTDDLLRPINTPDLAHLARLLPADTSYQILRTAETLGLDCSEVLAEVANATPAAPKSPASSPAR